MPVMGMLLLMMGKQRLMMMMMGVPGIVMMMLTTMVMVVMMVHVQVLVLMLILLMGMSRLLNAVIVRAGGRMERTCRDGGGRLGGGGLLIHA